MTHTTITSSANAPGVVCAWESNLLTNSGSKGLGSVCDNYDHNDDNSWWLKKTVMLLLYRSATQKKIRLCLTSCCVNCKHVVRCKRLFLTDDHDPRMKRKCLDETFEQKNVFLLCNLFSPADKTQRRHGRSRTRHKRRSSGSTAPACLHL